MSLGTYKLIPESFDPIASQRAQNTATITLTADVPLTAQATGHLVGMAGPLPARLGIDRDALARAGFTGERGQALVLPGADGATVLVGIGEEFCSTYGYSHRTPADLRDAAAAFARAAHRHASIALVLHGSQEQGWLGTPAEQAQMVTEGVLLARYRYVQLKPHSTHVPLRELAIVGAGPGADAGVARGRILARAACLARDLANTPPSHLTATDLGGIAVELGAEAGVAVETWDLARIIAEGCGGLLGVNAGSVEEPRVIRLDYTPEHPNGRSIAFVGKGIMYDSGGISLKPSDPMHFAMKMDMAGAAAVLAAVLALPSLGCETAASAYLMCTDNMPSGSAMKLGDVLSIRGGTTVEVKNSDAEGRLVMSDALVLASEREPDAIVDVATLTGAALAALGTHTAALFGTDERLVEQVESSAGRADESVWRLPLERRYRPQLDSQIADISNMGGKHAGATTAALFLAEFTAGIPWAHLDIAGTMQAEADDAWRTQGATGFGTRLLIDLALTFDR